MSESLNLTLKRGPSIWEDQAPAADWRSYGMIAGAVLAGVALQPRANRAWLIGLALGVVGTSLLAGRFTETIEAGARQLRVLRGAHRDQVVDRASEDSFPASDPPQYR